ncbi:hypothetical protein FOZ76_23425 [Verticiella sediminum]|uniref:Uncharacterized protein n=1 Tax=Verticiella sediminum TaxID=1247510 RepID=A0A556ACW6_9BURK|nr:hypothetical protein [Verticiella sediminum]TSH90736.1 hypothetical protein FOZ76_23425 [Verticiella sediminum]
MAQQGSNPISRHVDDRLKDDNKALPAADLPREDTDTPAAGGQNDLEAERQDEPARDPQKSGNRQR